MQSVIMPSSLLVMPRSLRRATGAFIAIVVYLVTLNVGLNVALAGLVKEWTHTTRDRLTITLAASASDSDVARILALLTQNPEIAHATPIPPSEVRALIAPLIHDEDTRRALPLPRLITVLPREEASIDVQNVRDTIATATTSRVEARVDSHATWLAADDALIQTILNVAWGSVALLASVLVLGVVLATRSLLAGQRDTLELLGFLGAPRTFIRTLTIRIVRRIALPTIATGWVLALATLIGVGILFVDRLAIPAVAWTRLQPVVTIAALLAVPVSAALLSSFAARFDLGHKR